MKHLLFVLICLVSHITLSQSKTFTLDWKSPKIYNTESYELRVPDFETRGFTIFDIESGLFLASEWNANGMVIPETATVSNVVYESVTSENLYDLPEKTIPTTLKYTLSNIIDRDKVSAHFSLFPYVKSGNGYKRVKSFKLDYKVGQSKAANLQKQSSGIVNSIMRSGEWYRFAINKTGIHKLSKQFLKNLGFNTNGIDPRHIAIYGFGGKMIPYVNDPSFPIDVPENAIKVIGEEDGVFNDTDYVLFYGQGPEGDLIRSNTNNNVYSDVTYYYITVKNNSGKRVQSYSQPVGATKEIIRTFKDFKFHEVDEYSLAFVGRRWFGDRFDSETEKSFQFNFPNLVKNKPVEITIIAASTSSSSNSLNVKLNGNQLTNMAIPGVAFGSANTVNQSFFIKEVSSASDLITLDFAHDKMGNPSTLAYLDYITIKGTRALIAGNEQITFDNSESKMFDGIINYQVSGTESVSEFWEISNIYDPKFISNPNLPTVNFKSRKEDNHKFVAVNYLNHYFPLTTLGGRIYNSNLKGTIFNSNSSNFEDIDYLMLTPKSHLSQATRLAEINSRVKGLSTRVVVLEDIYREFSTGNPDIVAIRNFVKYVYDNASAPNKRLRYLCLFGDGSFDYKGRIAPNTYNFPLWNAVSSFNLTSSFISDDFFGLMDAGEGEFKITDRLDIAVGRIVADTPLKAKQMVDKVETYYSKAAQGTWRNNVAVISDDVDHVWEKILENTTNEIGDRVSNKKPFINVIKIHSDAFEQQSTAGGDRYPEVTREITRVMENGALVINYFGHGGEDGIASERIFQKSDLIALKNECKLHVFVTVTCEYTKFDNPLRITAGELAYWNPKGGAINLITTTRQILVNVGTNVNKTLDEYLFSFNDADNFGPNEYPSISEAVRLTKNNPAVASQPQKLLIYAIGDPALELAIPKPKLQVTKVNDVLIGNQVEPIKALGYAKLEGDVLNENGVLLSNYSGVLTAVIYDKKEERVTLANDNTKQNGQLIKLNFEKLGPVIFKGKATVVNGKFKIEFIVPKDISIPVGKGRISLYAQETNTLNDKTGVSVDELIIGGINTNAPKDNVGPEIVLHMNDSNFVSGGLTNESPLLLVKLSDENGINTASGIGHDITAIIDGDEINPYILNDYYVAKEDTYKKGDLDFKFRDLKPGLHTLTLKAWDVYNNSSTAEIQFLVADEANGLVIERVLNYPNPFVDYTEFWFTHNSSDILNVSIQIFTVSGKLVKTINGTTANSGGKSLGSTSRDLSWDGRDDFGQKIGKGTYVYKLKVYSPSLGKTVEKIEKLVIL